MSQSKVENRSLTDVRNQIDNLDNKIFKQLLERAEIIRLVQEAKQNGVKTAYFRPSREAQIIRRLISKIPEDSLLTQRMVFDVWRAIINNTLAMEHDFEIALLVCDEHLKQNTNNNQELPSLVEAIDMVRECIGFQPIRGVHDIEELVRRVLVKPEETENETRVTMGFVQISNAALWRDHLHDVLLKYDPNESWIRAPNVTMSVPFLYPKKHKRGFFISHSIVEESGNDITLINIRLMANHNTSREHPFTLSDMTNIIRECLNSCNISVLEAEFSEGFLDTNLDIHKDHYLYSALIELDGFFHCQGKLQDMTPSFKGILGEHNISLYRDNVIEIARLGGYAKPIVGME